MQMVFVSRQADSKENIDQTTAKSFILWWRQPQELTLISVVVIMADKNDGHQIILSPVTAG